MKYVYALFFGLLSGQQAVGQSVGSTAPLFADDALLSLTVTTQLQVIAADRQKPGFGEKAQKRPALLSVANGGPARLPVTVSVRGNYRRDAGNCIFPPLWLDLPKKKVSGTVFAGQNRLKVVTHCKDDDYLVREYLVYKAFNQLTDLSYGARLARITYLDTNNRKLGGTHWGILLENLTDVASRNHVRPSTKRTKAQYTDSLTMAVVGVFEYMIGNTDWSVSYQHNVSIVADSVKARLLVVPYDFDYAGIVGTDYAVPDKHLGIESVRDRLYRGPSYSAGLLRRVFARFNDRKKAIYALYEGNALLKKNYVQSTIQYLDQFYKLINNPKYSLRVFGPGSTDNRVIRGLND